MASFQQSPLQSASHEREAIVLHVYFIKSWLCQSVWLFTVCVWSSVQDGPGRDFPQRHRSAAQPERTHHSWIFFCFTTFSQSRCDVALWTLVTTHRPFNVTERTERRSNLIRNVNIILLSSRVQPVGLYLYVSVSRRSGFWWVCIAAKPPEWKQRSTPSKMWLMSTSQGMDTRTFPSHWISLGVQLNQLLRNEESLAQL